jgi:hypothetical protein
MQCKLFANGCLSMWYASLSSDSVWAPAACSSVALQIDLLERMSEEDVLDIEQLTDINFLRHQFEMDPSAFSSRFEGLTAGLCDVIDNYSLLNFTPLAIEQPESVAQVLDLIDRANGFCMSGLQGHNPYPDAALSAGVRERVAASPGEIWTGSNVPDTSE